MRLFRVVVISMLILILFTILTSVFAIEPMKTNNQSATNVQIMVSDLAARCPIGSSMTIHWTINVKNHTGIIELVSVSDNSKVVIATNIPLDDQQYTWKIPSNFPAGSYGIEIMDASGKLSNVSNQFYIQDVTAKITILEPKDGIILNCKSLAPISIIWNYSGDPGKMVKIGIIGSNNTYYEIANSLIGTNGSGTLYIRPTSLSQFTDLDKGTLVGRIRIIMENGDYVDGPNITLNM